MQFRSLFIVRYDVVRNDRPPRMKVPGSSRKRPHEPILADPGGDYFSRYPENSVLRRERQQLTDGICKIVTQFLRHIVFAEQRKGCGDRCPVRFAQCLNRLFVIG